MPDLRGDRALVEQLTNRLIDEFNTHLSEHELSYIDATLAAHNFHRAIIAELVSRAPDRGQNRYALIAGARDTWVRSMDKMLKKLAAG